MVLGHENVLRAFNFSVFICYGCLVLKTKDSNLLIDTPWLYCVSCFFKIDTSSFLCKKIFKNHRDYVLKYLEKITMSYLIGNGYQYTPQSYSKIVKVSKQVAEYLMKFLNEQALYEKEDILKIIEMFSLFFLSTA
jgi:hypothetical protein